MYRLVTIFLLAASSGVVAQVPDSIAEVNTLDEVVVTRSDNTVRRLSSPTNTSIITAGELRRAACCNLGESFTTNPSVDVSYSDAATGARQIRLLGLSGTYVQMLGENVPMGRGVAAPFALGYVAGPWMQSIQVSKGASSVKNGYESVTGQINVEFRKPQLDPSVNVNLYYDSMNKLELNADANVHLGPNWSTGLLVHGENAFSSHDADHNTFADMPRTRQVAVMNRWARMGSDYVFQAAVKYLGEWRRGGQRVHGHDLPEQPYLIDIDARRVEFFTKNAYIYDHENDGNVALIVSGSYHDQDAAYGHRINDISQLEGYASLMYERKWSDGMHALSAGVSTTADHFTYRNDLEASGSLSRSTSTLASAGIYTQYTLNALDERLIAMAGLRLDCHNRYGRLFTPRLHCRFSPVRDVSITASAGRGYHVPLPLAEYGYLLASSRRLDIGSHLDIERAWNYGAGFVITLHPAGRKLSLGADYYYTRFGGQLCVDLNTPGTANVYSASRPTYSHAVQVELDWQPLRELQLSGAWRYTAARTALSDGVIAFRPLSPRHKGLLTASFTPMMGLWQADLTLVVTGGGHMPTPYITAVGLPSWDATYRPYPTLNLQLTRNFRHWSVYIGGENLTNYRQPSPIIGYADPWGPAFDATMVYGPLHGAMAYIGFRYNFTKYI